MSPRKRLPRWPNRPRKIAELLVRAVETFEATGEADEPKTLAEAGFSADDVQWLSGGLAVHPQPMEVAWHEAGHAVVAAAFGVEIEKVSVENQPVTRHAAVYSAYVGHLITHAGPIAERLARRLVYRPTDDELRPWLAMGRNRWIGYHDYARLFARAAKDHPDWDEARLFAHFREYERLAIELLTRWPFRAAIAAVADALLDRGTISGEVVYEIVGRHIAESDLEV
jgi:hypothetical protein